MLLRQRDLAALGDGTVTLAFRRWRRPTVRSGGTLLTPIGQLQLGDVTRVALDRITAADARRAGYPSRDALIAELSAHDGDVYRIEVRAIAADPRIALRAARASASDLEALRARLDRLDRRAPRGPWTRRVLALLRAHPGVRAADLCRRVGQEKDEFKINVRKLKTLGLTESLEVGYRLSPRGRALLGADGGGD